MLKPLTIIVSLFVLIIAIKTAWRIRRLFTWRRAVLSVSLPAVCLAAVCVPVRLPGGLAAAYLRGFERRMLRMADIDAIQQWLSVEGGKYSGRVYRREFPKELPSCLTEFGAPVIRFSGAAVEFRWDAPHGESYGLIVGPPSVQTPPEGVIEHDNGLNEFRRPVRPGAYVFSRG